MKPPPAVSHLSDNTLLLRTPNFRDSESHESNGKTKRQVSVTSEKSRCSLRETIRDERTSELNKVLVGVWTDVNDWNSGRRRHNM